MKNRFLKLASGLLVLCLMSTCAIGATFAKYTTGDSSADTARVAKWGVEVSTSGTLFGKAYGANGAAEFENSIMATTSASVNTSNTEKVVAPGTKNETGLLIKVSGTPEVAYNIEASTTAANNKDIYLNAGTYGVMVAANGVNAATDFTAEKIYYFDGSTYKAADATYYASNTTANYFKLLDVCVRADAYYPLKWDVAETGTGTSNVTATTTNGIADAIIAQLKALDDDANAPVNVSYTLTWAWAISTDDAADTILGNIAAGANVVKLDGANNYVELDGSEYSLEVGFNISVTATQVD